MERSAPKHRADLSRKKALFLLPGVWSLGRGKGLTSIHRLLLKAQDTFDCTVITSDIYLEPGDLGNIRVILVKQRAPRLGARIPDLILARIHNLVLNLRYFWVAITRVERQDLVYCSSSIAVFACRGLHAVWGAKTVHRIYGTFLFPYLGRPWSLFKKYEEVAAFQLKADAYIITDDGTRGDQVAAHFGIPERRIRFLRNGVDVRRPDNAEAERVGWREKLGLPADQLIILSVSRLVRWKRVDRVIHAFRKASPGNATLVIAGDGEERQRLEALAQGAPILFVGALTNTDVHSLMRSSDVFVSLFEYSNIGNTLLEALSYGLPIVTCDSGETGSLIGAENGLLVSGATDDAIIDQVALHLLRLSGDRAKRELLGRAAAAFAAEKLQTWDKRIETEVLILRGLAERQMSAEPNVVPSAR